MQRLPTLLRLRRMDKKIDKVATLAIKTQIRAIKSDVSMMNSLTRSLRSQTEIIQSQTAVAEMRADVLNAVRLAKEAEVQARLAWALVAGYAAGTVTGYAINIVRHLV